MENRPASGTRAEPLHELTWCQPVPGQQMPITLSVDGVGQCLRRFGDEMARTNLAKHLQRLLLGDFHRFLDRCMRRQPVWSVASMKPRICQPVWNLGQDVVVGAAV